VSGKAGKDCRCEEGGMRRKDLMKPDLLSEILLLGSGVLIFVTLIVIVVAALLRTPSLR
jgi:hypothetical protein